MESADLGVFLLIAIIAMAICMAVTPLLIRFSAQLGMIDSPDARKVHLEVIPRVGGIGIVLGLMSPVFIWLPVDSFVGSFLFGCLVLLVFGAWDDAKELGPYTKFFGQFVAAISVVYYGDIYVFHFPFMGIEEIPGYIGKPFTVIAIVGMINALNLSDGLDGLAGGEALISLIAITYLAYQFDGVVAVTIAAATMGGIFGFLRFNSHPARIFMGDTGSQTLGFVLAVLVVYLTQQVNSVVSPVVALLLLGLPVIDSIAVFYLRARRGDSLVVAAKDHLHHRLLALGFYHYESVIIIYSIQIILIFSAVLFLYESDLLLFGIYLGISLLIFSVIFLAEKSDWNAHGVESNATVFLSSLFEKYKSLAIIPYHILVSGLSLFVVSAAVMSTEVPVDFGVSALVLCLLSFGVVAINWLGDNLYRLLMFVTIGFSVYLLSTYPPSWLLEQVSLAYLFFLIITVSSFITMRIATADQFQITPLDYLVIIMAIIVSVAPGIEHGASSMVWMVVQIIILFYACELVIQNMKGRFNRFTGSIMLALGLIAYRGLV